MRDDRFPNKGDEPRSDTAVLVAALILALSLTVVMVLQTCSAS